MAERGSGSSKRPARPRRRRTEVETESGADPVEAREEAEQNPPRPVIEEAFDEIAAARAEVEDRPERPTEQEMDFEPADSAPANSGGSDDPPAGGEFQESFGGGESYGGGE